MTVAAGSDACGLGVRGLFDRIGLGRIVVDDAGQRTQTDPGNQRQGDLVDHVAGMPGNYRRTEDAVATFVDIDLDETGLLVVGNGPIGVGAPGYGQCTQPLAAGKRRITDRDPRRCLGSMGKLVLQANIADRINAPIAGA